MSTVNLALKPAMTGFAIAPLAARMRALAPTRALAMTAVGRDLISIRDVETTLPARLARIDKGKAGSVAGSLQRAANMLHRWGLASGWAPCNTMELSVIAGGIAMAASWIVTGSLAVSFEVLAGVFGSAIAIEGATRGIREAARVQRQNRSERLIAPDELGELVRQFDAARGAERLTIGRTVYYWLRDLKARGALKPEAREQLERMVAEYEAAPASEKLRMETIIVLLRTLDAKGPLGAHHIAWLGQPTSLDADERRQIARAARAYLDESGREVTAEARQLLTTLEKSNGDK